ncbi:hypothetical protein K7B09_12975 [Thermomonas sp. RSS23]|uniref:Lipoprotein n=1 Tax=Thermomonas beijingensis TaxID=2872701 RepID=A0ABS7TH98_9GAMM|nr:hypothetical protein [Thermomonas beijingensis]MBZ4187235.1 hypothetical protein [Thermomonas beijingensis]
MKSFAIVTIAIAASLAACASSPAKDPSYSGEYFYNFENAIFTPDGKDENWCLNGLSMQKAELPAKNAAGPWGTSHVVLRGKLGPRGSYGGLGRCKHVLTVTEIVEITNMRGQGE